MGRKMGSGDGSIFKSGKKWRGQITLGGERISISGKTRQEVSDQLAELRIKYRRGEYVSPNSMTVETWIKYWLDVKVAPNVEESTYHNYEGKLRNHIYPFLGSEKLQDLNRLIIEHAYADAFSSKSKGAKWKDREYSITTAKEVSGLFKRCLQYAVNCDILAKNPHEGVELQRLKPAKKVDAYDKNDQKLIIERCKYGSQCHRIYYFLVCTGLRFGEAAALTWEDIDLRHGKISITKTVTTVKGSTYVKHKTKTRAGTRTIFVGPNVVEWLKWHKKHQTRSNPQNLLFPTKYGNCTNHANARGTWQIICRDLGIEYRGMHALRHTWATRALEAGIDIKIVSKMLGHSDVVTTMNLYQDVLDDQKISAACALNAQY